MLAEPCDLLPLGDALRLGEGAEDVLHRRGAQAGEQGDAEEDEVPIVLAEAVATRLWVVVRKVEVVRRVGAGLGHGGVGEKE